MKGKGKSDAFGSREALVWLQRVEPVILRVLMFAGTVISIVRFLLVEVKQW